MGWDGKELLLATDRKELEKSNVRNATKKTNDHAIYEMNLKNERNTDLLLIINIDIRQRMTKSR